MSDEACREAFRERYGRYPGPLDDLAYAMFSAGWTARAGRGEPVAWMTGDGRVVMSATRDGMPSAAKAPYTTPLYLAHRSPSDREAALEEAGKDCARQINSALMVRP